MKWKKNQFFILISNGRHTTNHSHSNYFIDFDIFSMSNQFSLPIQKHKPRKIADFPRKSNQSHIKAPQIQLKPVKLKNFQEIQFRCIFLRFKIDFIIKFIFTGQQENHHPLKSRQQQQRKFNNYWLQMKPERKVKQIKTVLRGKCYKLNVYIFFILVLFHFHSMGNCVMKS